MEFEGGTMLTITFIIADSFNDDNIVKTEFKTDKTGLLVLQPLIDELLHSQSEYIVLVDGVPYIWGFWDGVKC